MQTRNVLTVTLVVLALGCGGPATPVEEPRNTKETDEELNVLVWNLVDPDPELVLATIDDIAWHDDPKVKAGLVGCLRYNDQAVIEKAVITLVKVGKPGYVKAIIENYPKNWPLEKTADLMKDVKHESVPEVAEMLLTGDDDQRVIAAMVLAKSQTAAATPEQIACLSDPSDEVKIWCIRALGLLEKFGAEDAVKALIPLLGHDNQDVRGAAESALENLTCGGHGPDQDAWKKWVEETSPTMMFCYKSKQELKKSDLHPPLP